MKKVGFLYFQPGNGGPEQGLGPIESYRKKEVQTKKEVCERCKGEGSHVNPSIDGNGITAQEMHDAGEEFSDNYRAGVYDVQCEECKGLRVIDVVDVDLLSTEDKTAYYKNIDQMCADEAEHQAELRAENPNRFD